MDRLPRLVERLVGDDRRGQRRRQHGRRQLDALDPFRGARHDLDQHVAGHRRAWDKTCIPAVCFTDPEIVTVGLSPDEAQGEGRVDKLFYLTARNAVQAEVTTSKLGTSSALGMV